MKKAILRVVGIALVLAPAAVGFAQNKKPTAATYITKEQVDTVNKTPGVDRTIQVMDSGHRHFAAGVTHRGSTGERLPARQDHVAVARVQLHKDATRPVRSAAMSVDPEPPNGSSTRSDGALDASMARITSSTGFIVG